VAKARESFKAGQAGLDPRKLVFVDETGTSTKMVRVRGRCRKGTRLIGKAPFGHWKTTTFTAALRYDGLVAPFVLDGPMTGEAFLAYVEKILAPSLSEGETVVIDNLSAHKVKGVRKLIEARGAKLTYLPPYSPDLNPSRWSSPSSRPCCARQQSAQETPSGTGSASCSMHSHQPNAQTILPTQDMRPANRGVL
jgi:hypothetical protein